MVITGHEHGNVGFTKTPIGTTGVLQYLEGGVLQERNDKSISSFAVLLFDFKNQQQRIVRLLLNKDEGIYVRQPGADPTPLRVNMSRKDRRFQISPEFREFLDDPDLPLADSKQRAIRLLDIFTYPDLKEAVGTAIERRWKLFKAERVLDELLTRRRVLIAASPKAGKTSLAKSLFVDLLSNRQLPVYIDGEDLPAVITDQTARQALAKAIKRQYAAATIEAYEQYAGAKRALIIDNLEAIDDARGGRERFLTFVDGRFDLIIAFADDEFVLEHFHARQGSSRKIVEYDCFYICEFGYISIEDLARRWLLSSQSAGSHVTEATIRDICKIVGRVLQINAIPHHPWVLLVLLQEASSGQEIAAKNGSYGHLFQAIVTSALYRSRFHNVDIETKYNYLAEFACAMFEQGVATFDEAEAKRFHESHCDRYDLDLSFDQMKADLIEIGIVRSDAGRLAFRTKYSYWFFVAWYLSRHMHKPDVQQIIERLCGRLHHEDTANIFIFLAHLSNEPHVLMSIVQTAKTLFADCPPVALDEDIKEINLLHPDEIKLRLPSTDAEENRRSLMAEKDREIAQRDASVTDGRRVEATAPATNDPGDDFTKYIRALQASMKTIDILGQVLRNGAGSIDAAEKREIVDEIYQLARRVNGSVLKDLPNQLTSFATALSRHFEVKYPSDTPDMRINRIVGHITHLFWLVTFALVRRVSHSLAHEMLRRTFDKVLAADGCIPNRLFDLSIKLDIAQGLPSNEAQTLYNDVAGNVLVRTVIRALIINHLYLYSVPENERQAICEKLDIEIDEHSQSLDPDRKKVKGLLAGPHSRMDSDERKSARKRKKEERQRRKR